MKKKTFSSQNKYSLKRAIGLHSAGFLFSSLLALYIHSDSVFKWFDKDPSQEIKIRLPLLSLNVFNEIYIATTVLKGIHTIKQNTQ